MSRTVIAATISLLVVSLATLASADTLVMRDGSRIEGTVLAIAGRTITFRHTNGTSHRYPTSRVQSLEFISADRDNPLALKARRLDASAGTELVVRTVETIDSKSSGPNQIFSAIVEQAVTDASGRVIIPADSSAQLMIRNVSSGGAGSLEMVLDVHSISIDGRKYVVRTTDLTEDSDTGTGTTKRTAATIGGQIGAADGAATQVLTNGRHLKVAAETVLRFSLDRPVTLQAED
jgi:hypothetical protein